MGEMADFYELMAQKPCDWCSGSEADGHEDDCPHVTGIDPEEPVKP